MWSGDRQIFFGFPNYRAPKGFLKWRRAGSNRQPPACKAGALPIELRPQGKRIMEGSDAGGKGGAGQA